MHRVFGHSLGRALVCPHHRHCCRKHRPPASQPPRQRHQQQQQWQQFCNECFCGIVATAACVAPTYGEILSLCHGCPHKHLSARTQNRRHCLPLTPLLLLLLLLPYSHSLLGLAVSVRPSLCTFLVGLRRRSRSQSQQAEAITFHLGPSRIK